MSVQLLVVSEYRSLTLKIIHTTWSRLRVFFFHLPLHSAWCVLLLYFTVVVACCLYSETAYLTFEFYMLFRGVGPNRLCVYENLSIPNVRCSCDMISIQWLTVFWQSKILLKWYRKGLRTVCSTDFDTVYNIWSQNKQTYQGWKAEMLVVWLPYLFE